MEPEWKQVIVDGGHATPFINDVEYDFCAEAVIYTFDSEERRYVTLCSCDEHEPLPEGIVERDA